MFDNESYKLAELRIARDLVNRAGDTLFALLSGAELTDQESVYINRAMLKLDEQGEFLETLIGVAEEV